MTAEPAWQSCSIGNFPWPSPRVHATPFPDGGLSQRIEVGADAGGRFLSGHWDAGAFTATGHVGVPIRGIVYTFRETVSGTYESCDRWCGRWRLDFPPFCIAEWDVGAQRE